MNRNFIIAATLPLALALAGCGSGGKDVSAKDESVESVANKVAAAGVKPNPGRWELSMAMGKVEMTGMPAGAQEAMTKQAGAATTTERCRPSSPRLCSMNSFTSRPRSPIRPTTMMSACV